MWLLAADLTWLVAYVLTVSDLGFGWIVVLYCVWGLLLLFQFGWFCACDVF